MTISRSCSGERYFPVRAGVRDGVSALRGCGPACLAKPIGRESVFDRATLPMKQSRTRRGVTNSHTYFSCWDARFSKSDVLSRLCQCVSQVNLDERTTHVMEHASRPLAFTQLREQVHRMRLDRGPFGVFSDGRVREVDYIRKFGRCNLDDPVFGSLLYLEAYDIWTIRFVRSNLDDPNWTFPMWETVGRFVRTSRRDPGRRPSVGV